MPSIEDSYCPWTFDRLMQRLMRVTLILGEFTGNCATEPPQIRNSTADTALSLDEGRQTGQSVGQQCVMG
ncbi:hypothetical protein ACWDUN_17860 [Mycobacterium sp. NPDC003323]